MRKYLNLRANIALGLLVAFLANTLGPIPNAKAEPFYSVEGEFHLPAPGILVPLSTEFNPPILKGIKVHPDNPFRFEFILDQGDSVIARSEATKQSQQEQLKQESTRLIKYFLASLTIPEKDLWVNLSPYEKDRIIPSSFGLTEMGRDLLAEDYMLKQITASLIYPEGEIGKKFWKRIYEEAQKKFGTTNIPVKTFNKVWIVPDKAVVYENAKAGTAYVVESKLKVMLEQDYLALSHAVIPAKAGIHNKNNINGLSSQIVREIVIPELTKEVNENNNFAQLRQVYNSLILATWYKKKIKDSILAQVYEDKKKIQGLVIPAKAGIHNKNDVEAIYQRYLQAFKKGAYNYIKEEQDPRTRQTIPKKYFSGGFGFAGHIGPAIAYTSDGAMLSGTLKKTGLLVMRVALAATLSGAMMPLWTTAAHAQNDQTLPTAQVSVANFANGPDIKIDEILNYAFDRPTADLRIIRIKEKVKVVSIKKTLTGGYLISLKVLSSDSPIRVGVEYSLETNSSQWPDSLTKDKAMAIEPPREWEGSPIEERIYALWRSIAEDDLTKAREILAELKSLPNINIVYKVIEVNGQEPIDSQHSFFRGEATSLVESVDVLSSVNRELLRLGCYLPKEVVNTLIYPIENVFQHSLTIEKRGIILAVVPSSSNFFSRFLKKPYWVYVFDAGPGMPVKEVLENGYSDKTHGKNHWAIHSLRAGEMAIKSQGSDGWLYQRLLQNWIYVSGKEMWDQLKFPPHVEHPYFKTPEKGTLFALHIKKGDLNRNSAMVAKKRPLTRRTFKSKGAKRFWKDLQIAEFVTPGQLPAKLQGKTQQLIAAEYRISQGKVSTLLNEARIDTQEMARRRKAREANNAVGDNAQLSQVIADKLFPGKMIIPSQFVKGLIGKDYVTKMRSQEIMTGLNTLEYYLEPTFSNFILATLVLQTNFGLFNQYISYLGTSQKYITYAICLMYGLYIKPEASFNETRKILEDFNDKYPVRGILEEYLKVKANKYPSEKNKKRSFFIQFQENNLVRAFTIKANGDVIVYLKRDPEIRKFFAPWVYFFPRYIGPLEGWGKKQPKNSNGRPTRRLLKSILQGLQLSALTKAKVTKVGGIDFTPAQLNLQTKGEIKFYLDPAMLAELQNATGFVPVIISIQPMNDLRHFLGL